MISWSCLRALYSLQRVFAPIDNLAMIMNNHYLYIALGFPGASEGEKSACNVGDPGSIPDLGRYPGEGTGNPFQYSCLEG